MVSIKLFFTQIKDRKMENEKSRARRIRTLAISDFLVKAELLLKESIEDTTVSEEEHQELYRSFQKMVGLYFPADLTEKNIKKIIKRIDNTFYSKQVTIQQELEAQIKGLQLEKTWGNITPRDVWAYMVTEIKRFRRDYQLKSSFPDRTFDPQLHSIFLKIPELVEKYRRK